jgi:ADP-ribose pyrophosphatase YjhB (NUDIX family)
VGGIIFSGSQVLLVKRGKPPAEGKWSIPGGVVKLGETLEEALTRELLEELSISVQPIGVGKVLERIFRDVEGGIRFHYIIIDYVCIIRAGVPRAGSDAVAASFFEIDDLDGLEMTEGTAEIVREVFRGTNGKLPGEEQ